MQAFDFNTHGGTFGHDVGLFNADPGGQHTAVCQAFFGDHFRQRLDEIDVARVADFLDVAYNLIENLVLVHEARQIPGGEREMLGFETLTLAPIDLRLVDKDLLSEAEWRWLNAYHGRVRRELVPHLDKSAAAWLTKMTQSI